MDSISKESAEEARPELPSLLDAAALGRATVITSDGKPIAVLVPIEDFDAGGKQSALIKLKGSGRGFWGPDAAKTIDTLRDE